LLSPNISPTIFMPKKICLD